MANEFDQFDAPSSGGNAFDQFDDQQPQGHFGEWSKAITDIPSEIGKQYSGAWQGVKEGLGPSGKGTEGPLNSTLKTGSGLLNAAYLGSGIGPAVVGTARSLIGHPLAEAEHAAGQLINPGVAAKDNPEEMYQTAAGDTETALNAMRPKGFGPAGANALDATAPSILPQSITKTITPLPIEPGRQSSVDTLRSVGIEPTAGDVSGREWLKHGESTLGNALFAGGKYEAARDRILGQYSRYVSSEMGENTPFMKKEDFQRADDRLGQVFENSSRGMKLAHDKQFGDEFANIGTELSAEGLSDPEIRRVQAQLDNVQNGFVSKSKGPALMTGETYQKLTRKNTPLDRAMNDQNPNVAYYATRIRSALDDALERTVDTAVSNAYSRGSPTGPARAKAIELAQSQNDLRTARRQWFVMKAAQNAAAGAGETAAEGTITPQKMRQMLTNTQDRKQSYVMGRTKLADVTRAANEVLSNLSDSKTAQRMFMTAAPGAVVGGAGGVLAGGLGPAGALGVAGGIAGPGVAGRVLMSRPMQAYLKNQKLAGQTGKYPWPATAVLPHPYADDQQRALGGRATEKKAAHSEVYYVSKSPYKDKRCNLCVHFIPATDGKWSACHGVKSPIAPAGYCERYRGK